MRGVTAKPDPPGSLGAFGHSLAGSSICAFFPTPWVTPELAIHEALRPFPRASEFPVRAEPG
jgi:hypothetical protein